MVSKSLVKYEVLRWVLWDNHKMSSQAGLLRFLSNFLPEEKRPKEAMNFLNGRLQIAYKVLDEALSSSDWLVGDSISKVLIACGDFVDFATLNISSPNTKNLRELQTAKNLKALLSELEKARTKLIRNIPIFVKISPDLSDQSLTEVGSWRNR